MNDGYLSYLLMLTSAILLASGWKNVLAREVSARELITFYTAWCAGLFFLIPITSNAYVQGVYVAILLLLAGVARRTRLAELAYLALAGILIGAVGYFIHVLYTTDPVLILYDPTIDIALVCAVLAWTVTQEASHQGAVIAIALLIRDMAGSCQVASSHDLICKLGDSALQDGWWVAVCTSRVLSVASEWLVRICLSGSRRLLIWMRGLRR